MANKKLSFTLRIGDTQVLLETGHLAPQANASVVATMGKTVVLATVTMGRLDESKDYFPLSVEYADKLYAGGIVKGGKWVKRELNPSDDSILFGRIIDRSVRPLFPSDFRNEVQIITTVLSNDKDNSPVIPAFLAASTALAISDIPFNSPVSVVRVGLADGQYIINPTQTELDKSGMELLVCTGSAGVNMIECGAQIVSNELVLGGIKLAKDTGDDINNQILAIVKEIGKPKVQYTPEVPNKDLEAEIIDFVKTDVEAMFTNGADGSHIHAEDEIKAKTLEHLKAKIDNKEVRAVAVIASIDSYIRSEFRKQTLTTRRFDGRGYEEIRPLGIEAGVLPCTHGSAIFQRGLTQALTVTTLSTLANKQYLEDSNGETTKRYIHYYSAMPFSTGQTGRVGRPGRREVGHGALAEKALRPVIPTEIAFPYTIILTSEVLSQNGSSSMASTCGSTMSMLDAGVPLTDKVAGISVGMVSDGDDNFKLLTDIAGIEDHFGDMDFKIAGTRNGITAIQLDIKRQGITMAMIEATFAQSFTARQQILDAMDQVLATARPQLSQYAPKIQLIVLPEDKIGEVIGSGGKTIKGLMEKYEVEIDIDDHGNASVSSLDADKNAACVKEIEAMIKEVQIGEEYDGVVTRVEDYGAFVEFLPGREALLHVSEMASGFVEKAGSLLKLGDKVHVRISGFNDNHQIKLASPEMKSKNQGSPRDQFTNRPQRPEGQNRSSYRRPTGR